MIFCPFFLFFIYFYSFRHTPPANPALSSHTTASNYTSPSIKSDTPRFFLSPETDIPDTPSISLISQRAIPPPHAPSLSPYFLSLSLLVDHLLPAPASVLPDTLYPAPYTTPPAPSTYNHYLHTIPLPLPLPPIPPFSDYHAPMPNSYLFA